MPVDNMGRELIELIQIDQDFCQNTYDTSPCSPINRNFFDFSLGSVIDIPNAVFTGDFSLALTVKVINRGFGYLLYKTPSPAINVINLISANAVSDDQIILTFGIYSGATLLQALASSAITYTSNIDILLERIGTVFYLRYTGGPDQSFDAGSVFDVEFNKISKATESFDGYIFNLFTTGASGGDVQYLIDDNSSTITDSVSAKDGTLTAGTGSWVLPTFTDKCFNTYESCQDKFNFINGTKSITLKKNQHGDVDEYTIPILKSFSVTLPELNIFSTETKNQSLGRFGRCEVSCCDVKFSDNHLDPYVQDRSYNPLDNGTFWTKFLARNPYYNGFKIRLYDGQVGQSLAEMNVREYEIEKITNPDSQGSVKIIATDAMRKLDKTKAYFPPVSTCVLYEPFLTSGASEITTVGRLTEYTGFSQYLNIEGDVYPIVSVTNNGDGTFLYDLGKSAETDYPAGTSVLNATLFADGIYTILLKLLQQVYEVDEFDYTALSYECTNYLNAYYSTLTRFISEPKEISELLGSLAKECGFYIWYDDIDKIVKFKSIRDEEDPVITIDQNNNLIENKTEPKTETEDRFTESYIFYNKGVTVVNPPYKNILLTPNLEASSANKYGATKTYQLKSEWLYLDESAQQTALNLKKMFSTDTRKITFELDIKDDIRTAQVFKMSWRGYTDIYGNDLLLNWICTGRTRQGDRLKIIAQEFKFNVPEE